RYPFVIAGIWTQTDLTTGLLRWFVETITDPSPVLPALATPPAPQVWAKDFRIMRQARPVPGEEIIKLPDSLVIDGVFSKVGTSTNATFGPVAQGFPPPPTLLMPSVFADPITQRVDILFAPAQGVVGSAAAQSGKVILWVRDRKAVPTIRSDGAIIAD